MPYVAPSDARNRRLEHWRAVAEEQGPPPWRVPLVADERNRIVLISWPARHATRPHVHPRADETFLVLQGKATFTFGDGQRVQGEPGTQVFGPANVSHQIEVGSQPLLLLCMLAPNEHDDTIEL